MVGTGRFDDPEQPAGYRVLYAGERRACFLEQLAQFVPDPLAENRSPGITREWLVSRHIGQFVIDDPTQSGRWLDFASAATWADFQTGFGPILAQLGYRQFDLSVATSDRHDYALHQAIGKWAFEQGFRGIRYPTRHDRRLDCWAVFEPTPIRIIDPGSPIFPGDPDLLYAARLWNLALQ